MSASIQARVLALVGAGVFVAVSLLALLSRSSLLALEGEVVREHERLAHVIAAGISSAVDDDLRRLAAAAGAPHVNPGDGDDYPERAALDALFHNSRLWSAVFFVDGDGRVSLAQPSAEALALATSDAQAIALRAIQSQRPLVSDVIRDRVGRLCILALVPYRATENRPAGAAAATIDVPSKRLVELLRADVLGPAIYLQLQGRGIQQIAESPRHETPHGGELSAQAEVPGTPWSVQVVHLGEDPLAPIAAFRQQSLWLAPSLAALAMVLGWGISRSVRRPLAGLTASAERIARGDLEQAIEARSSRSGGDEIIRLSAALDRMRLSLKSSMDVIAEANLELERRVADRTRDLAAVNVRLAERERLRQQLLRKVISAQEDERKRIARELHDETSQTLAALGMGVDAVLSKDAAPDVRRRLQDVRKLVNHMHQELHRLIVNLRPSVLDDLGLAAAIRWFAERHLGAAGIAVRCELDDLDVRLPPETEIAVFRAVQEAIVNVSRHAHAESVLVQVSVESGWLTIEIEDDGEGFDTGQAADGPDSLRGVGLLGMRERIEILGGTLEIDSEPGRGTRVLMRVPSTADSAAASGATGERNGSVS